MRRVALKATLWSTAALLSISVWRATALLLSDISAEWTADAVDTYAGKTAHWTILALITLGYLLHTLRKRAKKTPESTHQPRRLAVRARLPHHRPMRARAAHRHPQPLRHSP